MANLITIDLDNHFIMQAPKGEKIPLANITAFQNGWTPTVTTKENKEFLGSPTELDDFILNKPQEIRILNRLSDRIMYEETITVDNPISSFDFGVIFMQEYVGAKIRLDAKEYQTKVLKANQEQILKDAEQAIKAGLDTAFGGLTAL